MEVRFVIITGLVLLSATRSQYFSVLTCQIGKPRLGDRPVKMSDGSEITGIKVQFTPNSSCNLRGVEEFRGLQYGVLKVSDKAVLRFMRNKDPVRAFNPKIYATEHKPVCPQHLVLDGVLKSKLPKLLYNRLKESNQSEDCLWMNIFVPDTGKLSCLDNTRGQLV